NIPSGAQLLSLRTLKADGTVLEPENIEGKDTVSLPGVQIGDFIEYEYLLAHPPRGPIQPGFTASNFYFQIARTPNNWSTYVVLAPKGTGMKVDAHNVQAPRVEVKGDLEVFRHDERRVPPYIPEPDSPPAATEYLPFVTVGAGTTGNESLVAAYADAYLDRGEITYEVEEFARQAVGQKRGAEAVKALYSAVMQRLPGRDAGLTTSAAASLAQDRGSRLWLLKASLEAVGIPTRLVAIRTFAADPSNYLFPNEALLPYLALRADVPDSGPVWLDPLVRFGPYAELPEQASGNREAFVFPEPGRKPGKATTPPLKARPPKEISLELTLSPDGKLSGSGAERYQGMEAARLAEALDALGPEQRNQALQSALSRYFGGAELSSLKLELTKEVGAPLVVRYSFVAPQFARREGDTLVLPPVTFPARLGKRYVQIGTRQTPLYIDETERTHTLAKLTLPEGMRVEGLTPEVKTGGRYGSFVRRESQAKNVVTIEEDYRLDMARIPPREYEDFSQFAGEVDLIQAHDLVVRAR
ncbi:MAG TPA: hypothetical protein VK447_01060, partial [Myxococcaceae bacterium]|nr:hypothetical protein [Myxococcaceae bacterium]